MRRPAPSPSFRSRVYHRSRKRGLRARDPGSESCRARRPAERVSPTSTRLFHPSYPNYLAMVAGTDFGIHEAAAISATSRSTFPTMPCTNHCRPPDRRRSRFQAVCRGTCPTGPLSLELSSQHVAEKRGNYVRRHVPFLSFREVQEKWCDRVIRVDSSKGGQLLRAGRTTRAGRVLLLHAQHESRRPRHQRQVAGAWVKKFLDETFPEKLRQGTLVVVTFDESGGNEDNRIYTFFSATW